MTAFTVSDLLGLLETWYPARTAADWDRVGLAVGSTTAPVRRVHLAVDPTEAVAREAADAGADLLITHHPLLLRGIHAITDETAKGRIVMTLLSAGVGLYCGHTNVDHAADGTNDALADALGLTRTRPLAEVDDAAGLGRVGELPDPMPLERLARRLAEAAPATVQGAKYAGPADAIIRTVALCSGAGDSLLDAVAGTGADLYVTSDLRHHPASEFRDLHRDGPPYLLDLPHYASEWLWLPRFADRLTDAVPDLEVTVSHLSTDPWTAAATTPSSQNPTPTPNSTTTPTPTSTATSNPTPKPASGGSA